MKGKTKVEFEKTAFKFFIVRYTYQVLYCQVYHMAKIFEICIAMVTNSFNKAISQ